MAKQHHGFLPAPDHQRIHRTSDPRLRAFIPAVHSPIENANQVRDKPVLTLNRAGTSTRNPILKGLADRIEYKLNSKDVIRSLHVYRDRRDLGADLRTQAFEGPAGVFIFDHIFGLGLSISGDALLGAFKNYIRAVTSRGIIEREFYVKDVDADIVAINSIVALDPATLPATLTPIQIDVDQADLSLTHIKLPIDFFVSWGDEFSVLHNKKNPFLDPGFLKSYGGAFVVSWFDKTPGTEGIGTDFKPVTEAEIKDQHFIEVENTVGIKEGFVRFRAKKGSPWFRDVPIKVNVIAVVCPPSDTPTDGGSPGIAPPGGPTITFIPEGTIIIIGEDEMPIAKSPENGDPTVAGTPGQKVGEDLLIADFQLSAKGTSPKVSVRKFSVTELTVDAYAGIVVSPLVEVILSPLLVPGATVPVAPGGYQPPQRYRVAFSAQSDLTSAIVAYSLQLQDGLLLSKPTIFLGPTVRVAGFDIIIGAGVTTLPAAT